VYDHRDRLFASRAGIRTNGTPVDVTSSELAIESFFPADEATANALRR
jgi:hypothetical protein